MLRQPAATTQRIAAAMNMMPPIVGVPALELCQLGPISRMDCPALRARSVGMSSLPKTSESTNVQSTTTAICMGKNPFYIGYYRLLFIV